MDIEQQKAFDLCLEGHNVLVTGLAGTGKTLLLTIIARALKALGKHVQVTSTTGIASTAFSADLKATTIHRWSGQHDGRYEAKHTAEIIMTSPKQENTLAEIRKNDVLIIDEVSMLSRKMFDQLEQICSIVRGSKKYFGGMQIILSGDFYQLPPVPNKQYNDDG
ncbi:hypothetical protein DPMN_140998 [Dreissena polymorpha]|uniref:ATP-dependent DNA helicase n=1 Tax=Dreissena polymorpha TaxID=45954 RepID=A0A9D4GBY5_DREPO|nr:hypothetical protein DPMN_140998 [Dreissena polymorpha]